MKYYYNAALSKYFDRLSTRQMLYINSLFLVVVSILGMESTEYYLVRYFDYLSLLKFDRAIFSIWVCAFIYYVFHCPPFFGTWLLISSEGKGRRSLHMGILATFILCPFLPSGYLVRGVRKALGIISGSGFRGELIISTYLLGDQGQVKLLINRLGRDFPSWEIDFGDPRKLGFFSSWHLRFFLWIRYRIVKRSKSPYRYPVAGQYFNTIAIRCN